MKRSLQSYSFTWKNSGTFLLAILTIISPLFITIALTKILFQSDLAHYGLIWNDEIQYWLEINGYRLGGSNIGYFSVEELISSASFSHFGTHGPVYPMFMGTLAKIFGWSLISGPIYNLAFIMIGVASFFLLTRPNFKKGIYLFIFILLLYPVISYIPSTMQESFHQGMAFAIGGVLIAVSSTKRPSRWLVILGFCLIFFASLVRVTWSLLFFPYFWLISNGGKNKQRLVALVAAAGMVILSFGLYIYWTSSFPDAFLFKVFNVRPFTGINVMIVGLRNIRDNLVNFFSFAEPSNVLEILQRYLILFTLASSATLVYKKKFQFLIPLFIMGLETIVTIVAYDVRSFRDFRTLSPFLIISVLFMVEYSKIRIVRLPLWLFLAINLFCFPAFIKSYQTDLHINRYIDNTNLPPDNELSQMFKHLPFNENEDPWCNSLLTTDIFSREMLALSPGIGVNLVLDSDRLTLPIKSHYLFMESKFVSPLGLDGKLVYVGSWDERSLYWQIDDSCLE